jgi:hypothetical protein
MTTHDSLRISKLKDIIWLLAELKAKYNLASMVISVAAYNFPARKLHLKEERTSSGILVWSLNCCQMSKLSGRAKKYIQAPKTNIA